MTTTDPFDRSLPSPLARLRDLRARAGEAVVGDDFSAMQRRMYQPGDLERRLLGAAAGQARPDLVVIAGSAGGGKSAIIRYLLDKAPGDFGDCIADATHAEAPDQDQVDRLARFFAPFADGMPRPGGPTRLIAMNTGMVLRFFADVSNLGGAKRYTVLEQYMKERLHVPVSRRVPYPDWLRDAILILNLDHRPTAGQDGDIFDLILERLDPARDDGVLEGAPRCATCKVSAWCYPRANAQIISSLPARSALNQAAGDIALRRGRNLAPRALWDLAAQLALGGLDADGDDPCDTIAEIARAADVEAVVNGLATGTALDSGTGLAADLVGADPSLAPSNHVHDLVAAAGLDPDADSLVFRESLGDEPGSRKAVEFAAAAIRDGRAAVQGRHLARAAWLGGRVPSRTQIPGPFSAALQAQRQMAVGAEPPQELLDAVEYVAEGLAAGFGVISGPETYFPTDDGGGGSRRKTDVYVRADLVQDGMLWVAEDGDPVVASNSRGAEVVGYRPLSIALQLSAGPTLGDALGTTEPLEVNLALWDLLQRAATGTVPSSVDKERFLGLRRAMESVGRMASQDRRLPLLIRRRGSGRKFRIAPYGPGGRTLRASEVI